MDGQPLDQGAIVFDTDGKSIPAGGGIKDGKFEFQSSAGPKVVRISSSRETDKKDEYGSIISIQVVAPEFNDKSTLKYTVAEGENKDVKFEVKSNPPKK